MLADNTGCFDRVEAHNLLDDFVSQVSFKTVLLSHNPSFKFVNVFFSHGSSSVDGRKIIDQ